MKNNVQKLHGVLGGERIFNFFFFERNYQAFKKQWRVKMKLIKEKKRGGWSAGIDGFKNDKNE